MDVVVIEVRLDEFCESVEGQAAGMSSPDQAEITPAPGAALPPADSRQYRELIELLDRTLARYPDAGLVSATYDGTSLIVIVLPSPADCPGYDGPPPAEPTGPDDVAVVVVELDDTQLCELAADLPSGQLDPTTGIEEALALLEQLGLDVRTGPDLAAAERRDAEALRDELGRILAEHPDAGIASVSYDGAALVIVLAPANVTCMAVERPDGGTSRGDGDRPEAAGDIGSGVDARLPDTGGAVAAQAMASLTSIAAGAALLHAGRDRRRRRHAHGFDWSSAASVWRQPPGRHSGRDVS